MRRSGSDPADCRPSDAIATCLLAPSLQRAVHWIINNPTYVGKIRWRDKVFDGVHEPLVDEFTFAKSQAIMRERGEHAKRRGNASDFILSGLLRCGRCGKAYIGMSANGNGGRYHYYPALAARSTGRKPATANASHARRSNRPSSTSSPRSTATST